jgi:phosphonate transport system permease protein
MVGAGGIGVVLWEIIRGFYYAQTCAVMILIVITVSIIDLLSARVRKVFI